MATDPRSPARRRGQALMELAVGMFTLALVVSALAGFAVYMAKSLRSQNTVRSSDKYTDTAVDVDALSAKFVFGKEKPDAREKDVTMPVTAIVK